MVDEMGWWAIPIVSLVIFTLYGIEGIGSQLEDPFGYDRNDIKMDALAGDSKTEIDVVLSEWRTHSKAMDALRHQPAGAYHGDLCLTPNRNDGTNGDGDNKYMPPDLFLRLRPSTGR
jgi:putative membrane protein